MAQQPGQAAGRVAQAQHAEPQRRAGQGSADRQHRHGSRTRTRTRCSGRHSPTGLPGRQRSELLGDVGHDAAVGGRGRGQDRHVGRELADQVAQAAVVGPEVVPQSLMQCASSMTSMPKAGHERGQLLLAEGGVVEPLGRHQQHVDLVAREPPLHLRPLVRVRGVDRHRPHARALGGRDLVAHEGEQRRHQHGGARALPSAQQRRDEVHRGLAPAGALHHERAAAPSTRASIASYCPSWKSTSARPTSSARAARAVSRAVSAGAEVMSSTLPHTADSPVVAARDRGRLPHGV